MSGEHEQPDVLANVRKAVDTAEREFAAGNISGAVHVLRSAQVPDPFAVMQIRSDDAGGGTIVIPGVILVCRAMEAYLSLISGQWGDSPRHDPSSDTPHGVLTMYESLSPRLPEANPELRRWMDHLRMAVASDHDHWPKVAAWALDLFTFARTVGSGSDELRGVVNMAVAMSRMGYTETANTLYQQAYSDERLGSVNRATLAVRIGSHLWNRGEKSDAEVMYSAAITAFEAMENPTLQTQHEHVRALQRRASCRIDNRDRDGALHDIDTALKIADQARRKGTYQAVRSVDSAISDDLAALLGHLDLVGLTDQDAPTAIGALCRLANSAAASAAKTDPTTIKKFVTELNTDRSDILTRARMTARWREVSTDDITALMDSDAPVMLTAITNRSQTGTTGITIISGAGLPAKIHSWRLAPDERPDDATLMRDFQELLAPPPGAKAPHNGSGWSHPWHQPSFLRLASTIVPIDDLAVRLNRCGNLELRIVPVGAMWGFPYAAIPVGEMPLGSVVPIVLTTGPCINTAAPSTLRWAGHFDLSLTNALAELCDTFAVTRAAAVEFALFTNAAELAAVKEHATPASHVVFAGHGVPGRGQQRLRLATGEYCSSQDLSIFTPGASIVLNACWSGAVADDIGSDPADMALSLIGEGAHSVLGPVGPVDDAHAARFQRNCLHHLIAGRSVAESAHLATRDRLTEDPELPLSAWACYASIGRRAHFETTSVDPLPTEQLPTKGPI